MKIKIRQFKEDGLLMFGKFLEDMKKEELNSIPYGFIQDNKYSVKLADDISFDIQHFDTKNDFIQFLYSLTRRVRIDNIYYRVSLWSWLAATFFDTICPQLEDGSRSIGSSDRYILNISQWNRYYRHLIASPIRLYHELGNDDLSKLYLYGKPFTHGDILEQLASRQEIATVPGIIDAAHSLYWDIENNRPKKGLTNRNKKGNIRRFAGSIIPQFQMTYDLNSMTGDGIIDLLPQEFKNWLS